MRIMVCGYGGHGKDQLCEFLGLSYTSSSEMALHEFIWMSLCDDYNTKEECYADRVNRRELWYNMIKDYNTPDLTRLAGKIFEIHDVYCGIRDREEFMAARDKGMFDIAIWVDASDRLPPEVGSCTLLKSDCDIVIDNNGSLDDLRRKAQSLNKLLEPAMRTPLRELVVTWADEVFPERTVQNAVQKLLMEELPEYLLDRGNPLELGDLGVLLYDIAHLDGVDLEDAIRRKMAINEKRTWTIDSDTGLLNHTNIDKPHCDHCGEEASIGCPAYYAEEPDVIDDTPYEFQCMECKRPYMRHQLRTTFCDSCGHILEIEPFERVEQGHEAPSSEPTPPPVQGEEVLNTDGDDRPMAKCPSCSYKNPVSYARQRALVDHGNTRLTCLSCDKLISIEVIQGMNHVRTHP